MDFLDQYKSVILIWCILGLGAGVIAKYLLPGKDKGGIISTILLGIGGSFLGGFVGNYFNIGGANITSGINLVTIITAIAGAFILLILFRILKLLI